MQLCRLLKWCCKRLVYATLGIFVGRSEQSVMMEKARGILYTRDGQFTRQMSSELHAVQQMTVGFSPAAFSLPHSV